METRTPEESSAGARAAGAGGVERQLKHGRLAARTVAISFRAAMQSAERHLQNVPADEIIKIKKRWRAWAEETLNRYATELETVAASDPAPRNGAAQALESWREELARAFEIVRSTPDED